MSTATLNDTDLATEDVLSTPRTDTPDPTYSLATAPIPAFGTE